ncbi:PAS domain S-box-containing protein [Thermodesulfovibrio aggregans]|uniref:histidine kinase n=1 Tax=Thermodesulfovibrio aggregans TaxID=86166 RepID=A0A0U9HPB6_9BACT|nr:ATP-binding protein [Thermodesulfovibrio aggregans]GAQ94843.1 PAS domain S-box-containing protein [Thermodesulfovibrio aggregans]
METLKPKLTEDTLGTIFNSIEHNLSIMDRDLNILWINKAYAERLGMNQEDIIGKKCYKLWHKRNAPCEGCPCVKALQTGNVEISDRESDEGRYFILTGVPLKENGEIKAVFEIGREVTEKKIVDEKFIETIKLEGIYTVLDNLVHHFNNIFNGIYGFAQLLKERVKDDSSLSFVEKLMTSVERGSKFLQALLALGKSPSMVKVFDLSFLIISTKEVLKNIAGEKIKLELSLSKENPLIKGDPLQIREVLLELVQNAKNAISDDGIIKISTEKIKTDSHEKVTLTISDTGHGMNEETLQRCFEPLFTQDPRKFGLGLPIVKNIIQKHNGTIEIKSSPNAGTTVKILFPSATLQQEQGI